MKCDLCGGDPFLFVALEDYEAVPLCSNCFIKGGELPWDGRLLSIFALGKNRVLSKAFPDPAVLRRRPQRIRVLNDFIRRYLAEESGKYAW